MSEPIRDWFEAHDNCEFFLAPSESAFTVIPWTDDTQSIIYCTKRDCILHLAYLLGKQRSFATIARSGLPSQADVDWLASIVGSRRLLFLGDADPPDLLIYAWLRERIDITYIGITQSLLLKCGIPEYNRVGFSMSKSECDATSLLNHYYEDMENHLGSKLANTLRSGQKIEIEGIISFSTVGPSEIEAALLG